MLSLLQREKARLRGFKQKLIGIGITLASAINDSGLVVAMANVPAPTSYLMPSGSGWDHSYYNDFTNKGLVLSVPTTYGVNIGHYDNATDANRSGTVLGFMDGSFSGMLWTTVGYLYTPCNAQVTTLPQPVLAHINDPYLGEV
jgi:hypothetical protein